MDRRTFLTTSALGLASVSLAGPLLAGGHGRVGSFKGASGHVTKGRAEIVAASGGGGTVELLADFDFDGAPDPKVALGKDGVDLEAMLIPLQNNKGAQSYAIPASVNAGDYNEVWIWCEKYSVPLGVAKVK